jgi:hypothetical protein
MIGIFASQLDYDAQKYISAGIAAGGSYTPTEILALDYLFRNLKLNNFFTSMGVFYPMVGNGSNAFKFNGKDPRDLDLAHRLTFSGGWSFASTGMTPNGTTGYANTFYAPTDNSQNDSSFGVYLRTNNTTNGMDMGSNTTNYSYLNIYSSGSAKVSVNNSTTPAAATVTDTRGFWVANRSASGTVELYRNGSLFTSASISSTGRSTYTYYLGARNSTGTALNFSNREQAFAYSGSSFTSGQMTTLYTIIQNYQTILGRQV